MALSVDIEKKLGDFLLKVSFETEKEVFAILGASGCGKSMTLKCIAGIETPDKGRIVLDGRVLYDSEKHINVPIRKRNVGYMFQDYALFPNMTVLENIMSGIKAVEADSPINTDKSDMRITTDENTRQIKKRNYKSFFGRKTILKIRQQKAHKYIEKFYLKGLENLYPHQLSGGQKQRVAIARMLAAEPDIIMLDEPFSALDNYLKWQLEMEIMKVFENYGKSVLFVSHDRNEVYRLTDRIAVMEKGRLVDVEEKKELFDNPKSLAATLLTGCKNVTAVEKRDDGRFFATDWGIFLKSDKNMENVKYAAFRAHYFEPVSEENVSDGANSEYRTDSHNTDSDNAGSDNSDNISSKVNIVECQIVKVIEDTFSMVIIFKNKGNQKDGDWSLMRYELSKDAWQKLQGKTLVLRIPLDKIILLEK